MLERDWKRWLEQLHELSPRQRQALMAQLHTPDDHEQVLAQIDLAGSAKPACPHCAEQRVVRNGQADGLQRSIRSSIGNGQRAKQKGPS